MNFNEQAFELAGRNSKSRYWLISDLQQAHPHLAERYLKTALDDMRALSLKLDGICYLGDAAEGCDSEKLEQMIRMQVEGLETLGVPIYYMMGNHDLDYFWKCQADGVPARIPYYDMIKGRPLWHCVPEQDIFWFSHETEDFVMLFFSDHASKDNTWGASHQFLPKDCPEYPHTREVWQGVRDRFGACGKPVFTFSHCAFPGGNRPSEYLAQMLPLPDNFRAHFYGHAHIGDEMWAGKDLYRQIACVDNHGIMQFDIASLDHLRGTTVRSAVFDYYGSGNYSVFFRDHINHCWENACMSAQDPKFAGIPEKFLS